MRFGIKTAPQHTTWTAMLDVWKAADDIELFESAWNFDHFYPIFSDSDGPCLEAWTMLAAMAQATRRIRVGCQVTGMIYRHPAVLANMAATVDLISDGRLDVGLGAGWNQQECDAYGIPLPPLKERFDRFDEGVEALVLLSRRSTATSTAVCAAARRALRAEAGTAPHPPIVIGGNGPTRTLRTVARFGSTGTPPPASAMAHDQRGARRALRRDRSRSRDHRALGEPALTTRPRNRARSRSRPPRSRRRGRHRHRVPPRAAHRGVLEPLADALRPLL